MHTTVTNIIITYETRYSIVTIVQDLCTLNWTFPIVTNKIITKILEKTIFFLKSSFFGMFSLSKSGSKGCPTSGSGQLTPDILESIVGSQMSGVNCPGVNCPESNVRNQMSWSQILKRSTALQASLFCSHTT